MTQSHHCLPVHVDTVDNQEGDEVGDHDMRVQEASLHVPYCKHAEDIPAFRIDILEVVNDVDGNEDATGEEGDTSEEGPKEAKKA